VAVVFDAVKDGKTQPGVATGRTIEAVVSVLDTLSRGGDVEVVNPVRTR
jgi:hypothetical protein